MAERDRFFEVTSEPSDDATQIARRVSHGREVVERLTRPGIVTEIPDLKWSWLNREHSFGDIVATVDGVRLVSPKVREILDAHQAAADVIQWIPGVVIDANGAEHPHWVPHFPQHVDLLDRERSTFGPNGLPIRYVLSAAKLAPHAVTMLSAMSFTLVLAGRVVVQLQEAGCKGLLCMELPVAQ